MTEKKSLLESIDAQSHLKNGVSPFKQKEKTKPLRVRESYYEEIRQIAFNKKMKMVDVAEDLIKKGLNCDK